MLYCHIKITLRYFVVLVLLLASPGYAQEADVSLRDDLLGWSVTPGIGVRILDLTVTSKQNGAEGIITNDGSFSEPIYAALNIETPTYLLTEKFGITVRSHTTHFTLKRQRFTKPPTNSTNSQDTRDIRDVGTRVNGYYSYIMPTIFYRSVDKSGDSRFGIGYGYWKASFSGEVVLSTDSSISTNAPRTPISGSLDNKGGAMLFWQGRWPKGLFEITLNNVRFSSANYKYKMQEINMLLGLHFEF